MRCPRCHSQNREGANLCENCGHLTSATTMYREMDMRFWPEQAEAEMAGSH
jgi:uncharacterized membrane protein YvbJ